MATPPSKLPDSRFSRISAGAVIRRLRIPLLLTVVFLGSVAMRLPFLNRPLGSHHEWLTSTVVRTLYIWEMEGAWKTYKFLPIMSYPGKANYHIETLAEGGVSDSLGRRYYISYPPLAYIAPYIVLRSLGIHIEVLPLQIFSLVLEFICVVLIYLIVCLLMRHEGNRYGEVCAAIAATIYIFSPATLWYHSNVYMSDMFVQPLFILGVYLYLRIQRNDNASVALLVASGAVVFLMIYTEWLGVFFAFAVFLHGAYRWRNSTMRWMMLTVAVASALSFALILIHYSQIDGLTTLLNGLRTKFLERTALADNYVSRLSLHDWGRVFGHYANGFFPGTLSYVGIMALVGLVLSRIGSKERRTNALLKPAIYVTSAPVILHHLVLFNFTFHHEFSILKSAVLLSLLAGLFSAFVLAELDRLRLSQRQHLRGAVVFCFLALVCWINTKSFYRLNELGAGTVFRDSGATIQRLAQPDEVVFVVVSDPLGPYPQLVWYAKRNLAVWKDENSARQLMALNGADRAIVFDLKTDMQINVRRLTRQGNALVSESIPLDR